MNQNKNNSSEYERRFEQITNLRPFVLVTSGGRSGSEFLQSLLDSHKEILSFNGHIKLYTDFFLESKCLNCKSLEDLRTMIPS